MSNLKYLSILFTLIFVSCSESEVDPTFVESEYELDGRLYPIDSNLFWKRINEPGTEDQIRLVQTVESDAETDVIILIPVLGNGPIEGSYIYSKTGDIRTYDIVYVRNVDNEEKYEWITNGNQGDPLNIIRAGSENGKPIYTITLDDFDLNFGFYDFLGDKWVSNGIKKFRFQYQGPIDDAN